MKRKRVSEPTMNASTSRKPSAPSASKPSGMSERPVLRRDLMSDFLISFSPVAFLSTTTAWFSRTTMPSVSSPSLVSMLMAT